MDGSLKGVLSQASPQNVNFYNLEVGSKGSDEVSLGQKPHGTVWLRFGSGCSVFERGRLSKGRYSQDRVG